MVRYHFIHHHKLRHNRPVGNRQLRCGEVRRRDDLHPRPAPQLRGPRGIECRGKLYHQGLGPHEGAHGFHMDALGSGGVEPPAPDQRLNRHSEVTGEGVVYQKSWVEGEKLPS
jgi:hypothetical protein